MTAPARPQPAVKDRKTVGLVGFGALARGLAASFGADEIDWIALLREGSQTPLPDHVRRAENLDGLIAARPVAVVEAAGQAAAAAIAPALLDTGIPVVLASVGALADGDLRERLARARERTGASLVLPSGAVGGLDYLRTIAGLADARVRYTSRKPVAAWAAELDARGWVPEHGETVLFEGTAEEAARRYPQNLNVALTIALAVSPAPLTVRVVADPSASGNIHEIEAESAAGTASMHFANAPSPDNPKTSAVTALSLAASLRGLLENGRR